MDYKKRLSSEWTMSSSSIPPDQQQQLQQQPLPTFNWQQNLQKWEEDSTLLDYGIEIEKQISFPCDTGNEVKLPRAEDTRASEVRDTNKLQVWDPRSMLSPRLEDTRASQVRDTSRLQGWDPRAMLSNLSFMVQKIHQLQDLVHLIVGQRDDSPNELLVQQQQLVTADLTSIIVQLISTAGSLLPLVKQGNPLDIPNSTNNNAKESATKVEDESNEMDHTGNCGTELQNYDDHEFKEEEDGDEGENLPPGSYEILQLEKEEILAPHTHFCVICGKGFKRDANLRMHMRGHGDEYKTAAALAKPHKESSSSEPRLLKRYSCPFVGCKRNKDHKKFQPLKTILCVKNHYKRTHCDKSYTCSRCNTKKFSVVADLKTHEKHCGRDKWLCSCGTTFSRKDKLFGHIALFQGHTPAIPIDEAKGSVDNGEPPSKVARLEFNESAENGLDVKAGSLSEPMPYYSPMNFDGCNLAGFQEFPRPLFDDQDSSLSFLLSGSSNSFPWKNGGESGSNDMP